MESGIHRAIYAKKVINAVLCRLTEGDNPKARQVKARVSVRSQ